MAAIFDYIQTFFVDRNAVNDAAEILLTSVEVFFKGKPSSRNNISGLVAPGMSFWICDVINNQPNPAVVVKDSINNIEYDSINTSSDASIGTSLSFRNPVVLTAGKYYGIALKFDDPAFIPWVNKQGDILVGSNRVSPGSQSRFDGKLYQLTNSNDFREYSDRDLKFKVNIAKFSTTSKSLNLVNKDYEFFTVNAISGSFVGGEWAYQNTAVETGTLTVGVGSANVTGNGTTFTNYSEGRYIVVSNGSVTDVLKIVNITNTTFMELDRYPQFTGNTLSFRAPVVGKVYFFEAPKEKLFLVDSSAANATFLFATGNTVIGARSGASAVIETIDRFAVDKLEPKFKITNPAASTYDLSYKLTTSANLIASSFLSLELGKTHKVNQASYLLSRSKEVVEVGLFGTNKKSAVVNAAFSTSASTTNLFAVPTLDGDEIDVYTSHYDASNTYLQTRYGITDYDTEIEKNGIARSKHIAKKISFARNKYAEDLRVFVTAYRPAGTEIRLYAKIHNSSDKEPFDDKAWSPLAIKDNVENFSAAGDETSVIEYTYGLPSYPDVRTTLTATFVTQSGNDVISTSSDVSANTVAGRLVRVYNPLLPTNHEVFSIISSNSSSFTVNKHVTNVNIIGSMSVDVLKYPTVAFNNIANDNVARYYTVSQQEFDMFNSMQIKIVLLSDNSYLVPKIDKIEVIGVSA